ncbi:hypothetical protein LEM8419_03244 [Neolewinella maritima]|uniref:Response regulatory domain-containing protein n=1 Tax=Neolewinella maritima TaxID=1383882 RepID=A0ABM9B4R1_9BACT|nr:response regulator [Neolewinella maritima]CAH1002337.1 hypothetical protein LEM8419_03244 [Neolewinella maritima]
MKKLGRILLIDDSEADNFIHLRRFRKLKIADEVVVRMNGREGLDYLTTPLPDGSYPRPDLLFLDINMPVMDGWSFLDTYQKLPAAHRARVTIALLTSSKGDAESIRADSYTVLDGHESKPLHRDLIHRLLITFFPDRFDRASSALH